MSSRPERIQRWIGAPITGDLNDEATIAELEKDLPGLAEHIAALSQPKEPEPSLHRIAIVVGHSASAPGATAVSGESEFSNRSRYAIALAAELEKAGIESEVMFRLDGVGYGFAMRDLGARIDAYNPTFAIECHFNAFDKHARGAEFLYVSTSGYVIASAFAARWGSYYKDIPLRRAAGVYRVSGSDRGAGFLTCCKAPACLLEPGFFDNPKDFNYFSGERGEVREVEISALAIQDALKNL